MSDGVTLVERLVLFGHELRAEGRSVGSGDVMTFCAAAAALNPGEIQDLYWSGRTTLVTRRDQIPVYDRVFRRFFLAQSDPPPDERTPSDSASTAFALPRTFGVQIQVTPRVVVSRIPPSSPPLCRSR